jgi:hypothetical protein
MKNGKHVFASNYFSNWFEIVQICRPLAARRNDGWAEFSAPMPLMRAVREALPMIERDDVFLRLVRPRAGVSRLDDVDILCLSRRPDYPYQSEPTAHQNADRRLIA